MSALDLKTAEALISQLKCEELKSLLEIDGLNVSGRMRKEALRERCIEHVRSARNTEHFVNSLRAFASTKQSTKNGKKSSTSSLSATMACLAISRCEAAPAPYERSREMATQTATPVKKTTSSVYAQTELARSPKSDGTLSTRASSASFSPSSSSTSSFTEETEQQQEPPIHSSKFTDLAVLHRFDIWTSATVVTSRIEFRWPDAITQTMLATQPIRVHIRLGLEDERGQRLSSTTTTASGIRLSTKLLEVTVNGEMLNYPDGDLINTIFDVTNSVRKQPSACNAVKLVLRPAVTNNSIARKFTISIVVAK